MLVAASLPVVLDSCTSTSDLPANLPDIALNSSSGTPAHQMPGYEYPFDSSGNYVSDWAAEGERRAGRSPVATSSDEQTWSRTQNHGLASAKKKPSSSKAKPSSSKKKEDTELKPAKPVGNKPTGSKSGKPKSTRYVVKSSDTLSSIARKFGTTTASLKKANGLKSDKVRGGTSLVIPN